MSSELLAMRLERPLTEGEIAVLRSRLPEERRARLARGLRPEKQAQVLCAYGLLYRILRERYGWRKFPAMALEKYRWSFSLMMTAVQLVIGIPISIYMKNVYSKAMAEKTDGVMWRYLWLIPGTFYVMWYHSLYLSHKSTLEYALNINNVIFLALIDIGSFLVYHIVVMLSCEQHKRIELEEKNHQLAMKAMQYENIRTRIMEAQKANHDLRHHLTLMKGYLDTGAYDKLQSYLSSYTASVPEDNSIIFCDNVAVNLILMYFENLAKKNGADISISADIPEKIQIADNNISALLCNLLENAVDACKTQTMGNRRIVVCASADSRRLALTIDNTCEKNAVQDSNGVYISTKHSGNGIGIESVKDIVKMYNGFFTAEQRGGMFCVSVMLQNTPPADI